MNSKNKNKILSIGETLIRFNINDYLEDKNNKISYYIGGDALNVASVIGYNGNYSYYLSFVNKNSIWYRKVVEHLGANRIKSSFLFSNSNRLGTYYYLPKTSYLETAKVEYDRSDSAYAKGDLDKGDIERVIGSNFNWVHLSGISVAINNKLNNKLIQIVQNIYEKGKNVSFDLNYRSKLWANYQEFKTTVDSFLKQSTIAIGWLSPQDFKTLDTNEFSLEDFKVQIEYTLKNYPNLKIIISPIKQYNPEKNLSKVKSFGYHEGQYFETDSVVYEPKYPVGSGDAFTGMFISCLNQEIEFKDALEYANKSYAYKNLIRGDNCPILKRILEKDVENINGKIER